MVSKLSRIAKPLVVLLDQALVHPRNLIDSKTVPTSPWRSDLLIMARQKGWATPKQPPKMLELNAATYTHSFQNSATGAWDQCISFPPPLHLTLGVGSWTRAALAPYRRYPRLLGERIHAANYPDIPFCFLKLPPEIRNQIYRYYLVLDPIELAPKSTGSYGNIGSWKRHQRRYRYDIRPRLKLLRTNKQILQEAASIFYGENEFRFTNCKGWYVLAAFLRTIGRQNCDRLCSIAIHVPWFGVVCDNQYDDLPESRKTMTWVMNQLQSMGLEYLRWWKHFNMKASVARCTKILETAGRLESVKLILPDSYALFDRGLWTSSVGCRKLGEVFDASKFSDYLRISLVRLHGGYEGKFADQHLIDIDRKHTLKTQRRARELARKLGWTMETMVYDRKGNFPVPLIEGDRIVDLEDGGNRLEQ